MGTNMTPQQVVAAGVRLFAIWLVLSGAKAIFVTPFIFAQLGENAAFARAASMCFGVADILLAMVLWFFPLGVARKLVPNISLTHSFGAPALELARVGSCLLGLWLLATATPRLFWYFLDTVMHSPADAFFPSITKVEILGFTYRALEILIACLLVFKSRVIAHAILRPSAAATAPATDAPPAA
jgi:hypothetical protein